MFKKVSPEPDDRARIKLNFEHNQNGLSTEGSMFRSEDRLYDNKYNDQRPGSRTAQEVYRTMDRAGWITPARCIEPEMLKGCDGVLKMLESGGTKSILSINIMIDTEAAKQG